MHIKALYSLMITKRLFSTRCTSDEHAVESLLLLEGNEKRRKPSCLKAHFSLIAHGMSLLICFGLLCLSINVYNKSERKCIERFNAYCKSSHLSSSHMDAYLPPAPLLEAVDEDYQEVRFKYSLWYKSPYKGPPTPQVHQAWQELMQCKQAAQ